MIRAQRAPVKPRVVADGSNVSLLLEDEVVRLLAAGKRGLVAIVGDPGAGKTTAIEHLAAVLPPDDRLLLLDPVLPDEVGLTAPVRLVVYTTCAARLEPHLAIYHLAGWERDDLIEYLLACHRPRCGPVLARVTDGDYDLLDGVPELWRVVLDRLADDETLPDVRRALHRHLGDTDLLERARSACLNAAVTTGTDLAQALRALAKPGFADDLVRLLRYPMAQKLLAAERVAVELHGNGACDFLAGRLPRDLVRTAAGLLADDARALEHLHQLLAGPSWSHAMSVSLLHAAGVGWAPAVVGKELAEGAVCHCPLCRKEGTALPLYAPAALAGAYLDGVRWRGADLHGGDLTQADLSGADLAGANLAHANACKINLNLACLLKATLDGIIAAGADLTGANLANVSAGGAVFQAARLEGANLAEGRFRNAYFGEANLNGASFRGADLTRARFSGTLGGAPDGCHARLKGANFTEADLTEAVLRGLCLRKAVWTGARFTRANLADCDLENLTLPDANFADAWLPYALLTGTVLPGACFVNANLSWSGLAGVEWEGVDLRGADLRHANFHLGSSRSGLVGSPLASEGSRTGFYTDDYDDQTYKVPEEIRKANLCGADLRGAKLDGVDFYLVDLRGALYDVGLETHLRDSGAILGTRV